MTMNKNNLFKESIIALILILVLIFSNVFIKSSNSEKNVSKKISSSIEAIQSRHDSITEVFKNNTTNIVRTPKSFFSSKKAKEYGIYIFTNDSVTYWSSDINDPYNLLKIINNNKNIYRQGNNYYYVTFTQIDSVKFFTSTPLYFKNPIDENQNRFIPEKINGEYNIEFNIVNDNIEYNLNYQPKMNELSSYLIGILLIIIFIHLLKLNYLIIEKIRPEKNNILFFIITSTLIYTLLIVLQNNLFISTSDLFSKSCLRNNVRHSFSLGVLTEFSILIFSNVILLSSNLKKNIELKKYVKIILSSFTLIFILLSYTNFTYRLITNIDIPFSFLHIYDTTLNSYIFLIVIGILSCSAIILAKSIMRLLITKEQSYFWSIVSFIVIGAITEIILNKYDNLNYSLTTNIVSILLYFTFIWEEKSQFKAKKIFTDICIITLMTIQLTYILYLINENKEKEEMEWFATVVGDESDKNFENTIAEFSEEIKKDKNIIHWQKTNNFPSDDSLLIYFNENYFNKKEIKDYNKTVTLCDTNTILIIKGLNEHEINCHYLFNEIAEYNHSKKINKELTLIDDPSTDSYYILKLDLSSIDSTFSNYCYIEFYKEYILNYIGIPEQITSYNNILKPNLVNYSVSCYEDTILQYKYGFYNYPNELGNFRYKDEEYVKTKIFKHFTKVFDNHKTIIVTIEKPRFIDIIAPFSYIFLILSVTFYLGNNFNKKIHYKIKRQSFHGKMQLTIILTLGFSFIVAGITSFIFMRNSLNNKGSEHNYEKNKTIVKNIENDYHSDDINHPEFLKKYKETFFTDINVYDLNGNLINTTQPKLFDGYKSKIINRRAYEVIKLRNRFFYFNEEEIDGNKYNSSYFPLKDNKGNLHAIINIPYYDNKTSNKSSMSNFIITYINIILVLMGISALVVILMTRKTIKPLELIQDKMQKISLGGKNETIEWKSKDEIGELIEIYNKLIKELEISANNLMRSERETAWREMARQVAHEIKNPLTPMKLNIQFLQMAWDENNPDIDKKLRDTTKSILEQIDILSNIATAFSNYAKLPQKNIEECNLKEIIKDTIVLYDNNENIKIDFIEESESDYQINSDKNNLSIVFGNIIKNAIQAIGKRENGHIKIQIKESINKYLIEINDNGCGIKEEEKKKIFMPNFTTKSSGMGVGLSIVYDILETLDGTIKFESEAGKGTTFFIEIKK